MKGPVPLAFRDANVSSLPWKFWGFSALCFLAQALLIKRRFDSAIGKTGVGAEVTISTVKSSTLRAPVTFGRLNLAAEVGARARSTLKTTSSAPNLEPS